MIEFSLPQSSEVNLVVYDLSGRVVAELAKGKFEAGNHKINFDARGLASGVYFVRLKAGDFVVDTSHLSVREVADLIIKESLKAGVD